MRVFYLTSSQNISCSFRVFLQELLSSQTVLAIINLKLPFTALAIELGRIIMVVTGAIIHLLYLTIPAQKLIDQSFELFISVYRSEWYNVPERSKRLLRFIMLKSMKPLNFTAGGLYIMNLTNFGSIMKTALSYITVISSFN